MFAIFRTFGGLSFAMSAIVRINNSGEGAITALFCSVIFPVVSSSLSSFQLSSTMEATLTSLGTGWPYALARWFTAAALPVVDHAQRIASGRIVVVQRMPASVTHAR